MTSILIIKRIISFALHLGYVGQLWVQSVSTTPATSVDVQQLQEQLDLRLQEQEAFETGICPVRRDLYTQCFGERCRCHVENINKNSPCVLQKILFFVYMCVYACMYVSIYVCMCMCMHIRVCVIVNL